LLRCDQAVSWLWACRKVGFNRDVARLIANEVFDGFKYVNGMVRCLPAGSSLKFENGQFHGSIDSFVPCRAIVLALIDRKFKLDGRNVTEDEAEAIVDVLRDVNCGGNVVVETIAGLETTTCKTFGDILRFSDKDNFRFCVNLLDTENRVLFKTSW
jgi:hypothetical protein